MTPSPADNTIAPRAKMRAEKLFNIGLSRAADALGRLTLGTVRVQMAKLETVPPPVLSLELHAEANYKVLKTNLKGEVSGYSWLIFEEEQALQLAGAMLKIDKPDHDTCREVLLELDNILSAAFVTVLADFSGKMVFGHVPQWIEASAQEVRQLPGFTADSADCLLFRTTFVSQHVQISPLFVWVLDIGFVEELSHTLLQPDKSALLRKQYRKAKQYLEV